MLDGNSGICGSAVAYCTAGTSASGCQGTLSATGTTSATATSGFTVSAAVVEGQKGGLYFYGQRGRQDNPWGNGTSLQCVVPPVPGQNPLVGQPLQLQLWFRDPQDTSSQTTSLSNALEVDVCP